MLMLKCSGRAHASVRLWPRPTRVRWRRCQLCLWHLLAAAASQCGPFLVQSSPPGGGSVCVCVSGPCCWLFGMLQAAHEQMPSVLQQGLLLASDL
jgi:hypothetical protein